MAKPGPSGREARCIEVGYLLRPARAEELASRGLIVHDKVQVPGWSSPIRFLPLDLAVSPGTAPDVRVLLHKISDFEVHGDGTTTKWIRSYLEHHPDTVLVDPLERMGPVLDRRRMMHAAGAAAKERPGLVRELACASLDPERQTDWNESDLESLTYPVVVKSQVGARGGRKLCLASLLDWRGCSIIGCALRSADCLRAP